MALKLKVYTLFPEIFPGFLGFSLTGRALEEGIWSLETVNIRDYALDKHGSVDDTPCGGGAGMVMRADILGRALKANHRGGRILAMSPRGLPLTQEKVHELSRESEISVVCGRFEGIDERVLEAYGIEEVSIGEVQEVSGFDGDLEMSINENDYIQLNIDPAKLDSIQSIAFNFAYISDDGKAIVFLGKDNDLECDWEKGVFQDNFRGVWGSINDRECYMELVYEGDDYNLYTVPIKLNGEDSYLSVAYDYEAKDFYILGATSGVDESGQAGKDMRPLEKGDKVAIVYYAQSMEGNDEVQEMPDDEFTWKESYEFKEKDLPDGKYAFTYEVTDITGKSTMSDVAFLNLKNGEIKPEL